MVTTRYSDQQRSKSRQKVMRLYQRWHRQITKWFIKPPLLHIESSLDRLGLLSPTHHRRWYQGQRVTSWWQPATQTNRDPNRDKKLCDSTSNGTDQYQNGSSNFLTPYREQLRSTRIVVAYPRPAFSAIKANKLRSNQF